jgi:hypothetical protein
MFLGCETKTWIEKIEILDFEEILLRLRHVKSQIFIQNRLKLARPHRITLSDRLIIEESRKWFPQFLSHSSILYYIDEEDQHVNIHELKKKVKI